MYYLALIETYKRMKKANEPAWSNTLKVLRLLIVREYKISIKRERSLS
uniref:Uncharacterized protein n=1 Tax=viral metagenome TaxID=1070528 RepID=A0A6H1ZBQ3_9ZZZZ